MSLSSPLGHCGIIWLVALTLSGCRCASGKASGDGAQQDAGVAADAGALAAAPVQAAEEGSRPRLVRLDEVIPTPPSPVPTTAMLRARSLPPSGRREQVGTIAVATECGPGYCSDGLLDLSSRRVLVATMPTAAERESLAGPGTFERALKVAYSGDSYVSVYQGYTEFAGGAHANNELSCATWDRRGGRKVSMSDIVSHRQVKSLEERAVAALEDFLTETGHPRYTLDEESFLYDEANQRFILCARAPYVMEGTIVEILVDS